MYQCYKQPEVRTLSEKKEQRNANPEVVCGDYKSIIV